MKRASVWISGAGVVSAAGIDVPATLQSLGRGERHFAGEPPFPAQIRCPTFQVTGELPDLGPQWNNCRTLRLAAKAVREAVGDAALEDDFASAAQVGVCVGTTVASQLNSISFYSSHRRGQRPPLGPVYDFLHANAAQAIAQWLGARGPRATVVNACSSGADAIGIAAGWIRAGLCDVAVAGGADELNRVPLAGFWALGVMSSQPCAPFDRDRTGLNLGEGAGMLVLESAAHAERRGHRSRFEMAGFGAACDAHHLTAPHPEGRGLRRAIAVALDQAGIEPARVAFVNAHGTGTPDNDRVEGRVLADVFGPGVAFLSTKGYTGHTLGAAGGLEAAFTLLGLREGWIPASAGFSQSGDDIPAGPVRSRTVVAGDHALSTSLAFGGNNAAIVIRRVS